MAGIFKKNDIRGTYNENLTDDIALKIGYIFGKMLKSGSKIVVCGDTRQSTPNIKASLIRGLLKSNLTIYDQGVGPTPSVYFSAASNVSIRGGIMITGSHNPPNQNGIKICNQAGVSYHYDNLFNLIEKEVQQVELKQITEIENIGGEEDGNFYLKKYYDNLYHLLDLKKNLRVLIDLGNGATFQFKDVLKTDKIEVEYLRDLPSETLNNSPPDPAKVESYDLLKRKINDSYDFGIIFDTDGDRVGFIMNNGEIISPDHVAMIFAEDVKRNKIKPKIIIDVKVSKATAEFVESIGGEIHLSQVGHSFIHELLVETKSDMAAELSGHYYFQDKYFGFDDGLYAAVRFTNAVSSLLVSNQNLENKIANLPKYYPTHEFRDYLEENKILKILQELENYAVNKNGKLIKIDGLRAEFESAWFLARKSGTEQVLSYRIEGKTEKDRDLLLMEIKRIINNN